MLPYKEDIIDIDDKGYKDDDDEDEASDMDDDTVKEWFLCWTRTNRFLYSQNKMIVEYEANKSLSIKKIMLIRYVRVIYDASIDWLLFERQHSFWIRG